MIDRTGERLAYSGNDTKSFMRLSRDGRGLPQ